MNPFTLKTAIAGGIGGFIGVLISSYAFSTPHQIDWLRAFGVGTISGLILCSVSWFINRKKRASNA